MVCKDKTYIGFLLIMICCGTKTADIGQESSKDKVVDYSQRVSHLLTSLNRCIAEDPSGDVNIIAQLFGLERYYKQEQIEQLGIKKGIPLQEALQAYAVWKDHAWDFYRQFPKKAKHNYYFDLASSFKLYAVCKVIAYLRASPKYISTTIAQTDKYKDTSWLPMVKKSLKYKEKLAKRVYLNALLPDDKKDYISHEELKELLNFFRGVTLDELIMYLEARGKRLSEYSAVDLSNQRLISLDVLNDVVSGVWKCEILSLRGNLLRDKPSTCICKIWPNVQELSLAENRLREFPDTLQTLMYLRRLSLRGNRIKRILPLLSGFNGLIELNLSLNRLSAFPLEVLRLPALQVLNLSGNALQDLPEAVPDNKSITHLDLSVNKIKEASGVLRGLLNLIYLNLAYNKITTIPQDLTCLPALDHIVLKNNVFDISQPEKFVGYDRISCVEFSKDAFNFNAMMKKRFGNRAQAIHYS